MESADLKAGTGAEAVEGRRLSVHYTGWLIENGKRGRKFDSSRDRNEPFTFKLGSGQVIAGWEQGVPGMKVGGIRKLTIPPSLAYGSRGAGNVIPPESTLEFEIELLRADEPLSAIIDKDYVCPAVISPEPANIDANGMSLDSVVILMDEGKIRFRFFPKDAPCTVARMRELIASGFYDGLEFHRVVPGFVVQGGDPLGNGTGGSGKQIRAEFNERHHREGTVAMARASDPDSADSQFYISLGTFPHLDGSYTVFGQVVEGMDVVRKIRVGGVMRKVIIEKK